MIHDIKCVRCGKCAEACPEGAITLDNLGRHIDHAKCNLCLECARVCPQGAIIVSGKHVCVEEVVDEVNKDSLFYQNSGGGVTISGGEPLLQWKFVLQVFKACQQKGIHTALDTCGYASWAKLIKVLEYVDLVLFDLKHMDPTRHKQMTGVGNKLILSNLEKTAHMRRTWLRIPLIPDFNDDSVLREMAEFASRLPLEKVSILPYHAWGESKYEKLGRVYPWKAYPPTEEHINEVKQMIEGYGLECNIGS
jgi:pyruvate formate lyase activating enzyme